MTLREQQSLFCQLLAKLVTWAFQNGYVLTMGEVERTAAQAAANAASGAGISNSLHLIRLAADLHLYTDGVYQTSSEAHRPLGTYWKALNPLCRWGGYFKDSHGRPKPDGNHYSMTWEGRQ